MYSNDIIRANQIKVFFYMALITIIIVGLGYVISEFLGYGLMGTGVFLIFAVVLNFVSYFFSDTLVIKSTGAVPIKEESMPEYYKMVREMCQRNNIKMPRLYIINTNAMNAFATGRNQDRAVVAVTKGLIENLTPEEVSGVVGHELSHIVNGDILLMSVIAILVGFISIVGNFFFRSSILSGRRKKEDLIVFLIFGLILGILAPFIGTLIKMAISRSREYMADAKGAQICGNPKYLASALEKIKGDNVMMPNANQATAHLYISNPFKNGFFSNLMSTHPNINDRISKLSNLDY